MSDFESRPRPQYGEYATPEEQRARIAQPDTTDALETGHRPDAAPAAPSAPPAAASAPGPAPRRPRSARAVGIDRIATIALLVYGLINVIFTAPQLFAFDETAENYFSLLGIEEAFTNLDAARVWGPVAGGLYLLGWAASAFFGWSALRRGRVAFWIPLVGAVATTLVVSLCLTVPLVTDPAFAGFVAGMTPGG